jgi:hypothetical protein
MEKDTEQTIVIFRKWRDKEGGILALMPELASDVYGHYCTSYEHIGQHGGADYHGCIQRTRPATPEEYASLLRELTDIGYNVLPRKRATYAMQQKRQEQYSQLRKESR